MTVLHARSSERHLIRRLARQGTSGKTLCAVFGLEPAELERMAGIKAPRRNAIRNAFKLWPVANPLILSAPKPRG